MTHTLESLTPKRTGQSGKGEDLYTQIFKRKLSNAVDAVLPGTMTLVRPARLSMTVIKIIFRNDGKVSEADCQTRRGRNAGQRGAFPFCRLNGETPRRCLKGELGAPFGPFELWPLDKNPLLKKRRSLGVRIKQHQIKALI